MDGEFKLPRSILPNGVCVCLGAWCVSGLLDVCMCVCTFNSMLLYDFCLFVYWRICHTLWLCLRRLGNQDQPRLNAEI